MSFGDLFFDPLFDIDGDGKMSLDEEFLEFMVMQECMKDEGEKEDRHFIGDTTPRQPTSPKKIKKEEIDVGWRDQYWDNMADVDPRKYETLEDFLDVYEPAMETMYKLFGDHVRKMMARFMETQDIHIAAAGVYMSAKEQMNAHQLACLTECLSRELQPYGIKMSTILSVVKQLEAAIKIYDEDPNTTQEFEIKLS